MPTPLIPDRCRDRRDFEGLFECATRAHGLYRIAFKNARATAAQRAKVGRIEKAAKRMAGGRIFRQAKGAWHRQRLKGAIMGVTDKQLRRSAQNNINLARGALIKAGTRARSCERQFTQLVKATAQLKAASTAIGMMEAASPDRLTLKRKHAVATKTARTTLARFKDRCFV